MELVDRRADAIWLRVEYAASERRVCGLMGIAVSSYRYRTQRSDEPLRTRLVELAREKPRFGYRRLQVLLQRSGEQVNHKRCIGCIERLDWRSGGRSASIAYAKESRS
jgi:putative transposase